MPVLIRSVLQDKVKICGDDGFDVDSSLGWNATTYDSCVGEIITLEGEWQEDTYVLEPRGIVWLVSAENYALPSTVTGITTLKTTWTKSGVMTLTSGIVDPGYSGPLSTAVINFSKTKFKISKGTPFFRTIFLEHDEVPEEELGTKISRREYLKDVKLNAQKADATFLTIESFSKDVLARVTALPKMVFWLTAAAIFISLTAILIPVLGGFWDEFKESAVDRESLRNRVEYLEDKFTDQVVDTKDAQMSMQELQDRVNRLEAESINRSSKDPAPESQSNNL